MRLKVLHQTTWIQDYFGKVNLFVQPEKLDWIQGQSTLPPRPNLVLRQIQSNSGCFWAQSRKRNTQVKSESSYCRICRARIWEGLTHDLQRHQETSKLKGLNRCLPGCLLLLGHRYPSLLTLLKDKLKHIEDLKNLSENRFELCSIRSEWMERNSEELYKNERLYRQQGVGTMQKKWVGYCSYFPLEDGKGLSGRLT